MRHRYVSSHLFTLRPPAPESPRPGSSQRSTRSEERRLRALVRGNRERREKYVTVETKSRDLREDRGLRVRVVGFFCEFHLGEQVLSVLLEASH